MNLLDSFDKSYRLSAKEIVIMNYEHVTVWVTKYVLTEGIKKVKARVCHDIAPTMIEYGNHAYAHGKDWHRTQEAAIARAEEMRLAKIKSLEKSIAKFKALRFTVSNEE